MEAVGTGIELYDFGGGIKVLPEGDALGRPISGLYQFPSTRKILFFHPKEAPEQLRIQLRAILKIFDEVSVKVPDWTPGEECPEFNYADVVKKQLEELVKRGLD